MTAVAGPGSKESDGASVSPRNPGFRLWAFGSGPAQCLEPKVQSPKPYFAPEYSSICVVRSIGYDTVTSVILPDASVTAVSFGITKPV